MKHTDIRIVRFDYNDCWVDIVDLGDTFEAWICKKNEGESHFLFGIPKDQQSHIEWFGHPVIDEDEFIGIVEDYIS